MISLSQHTFSPKNPQYDIIQTEGHPQYKIFTPSHDAQVELLIPINGDQGDDYDEDDDGV